MTDRWQRVEVLFRRALELPESERSGFLRDQCGGEPATLAEVESLLANHDPDFLRPAPAPTEAGRDHAADRSARIGNYRILRLLGEGGMGQVYLAQQEQPLRRLVAIKLIKSGTDSDQILKRFEVERLALARMNHTNVAHVYDAGTTDAGLPYFAMEYIEGASITEYCDEHRLGTEERLELFLQVCAGVHHAHEHDLVHRDLKPSNIIVKSEDGRPVPKIIDFGVAKAVGLGPVPSDSPTSSGQLIGTPEYMSPEQAQPTAATIDRQTDVYSLGVVLYEQLTGTRPLESRGLREKGLEELRRAVRDTDPPTPSRRLKQLGESAHLVAERRQSAPRALARQLRRGLDRIVMTALEKNRNFRYRSARELGDAIRRYLSGVSTPASPYDIVVRSVRRHWMILAAVVLIAIIAGGWFWADRWQQSRRRPHTVEPHPESGLPVLYDDRGRELTQWSRLIASDFPDRTPRYYREKDYEPYQIGKSLRGAALLESRLGTGERFVAIAKMNPDRPETGELQLFDGETARMLHSLPLPYYPEGRPVKEDEGDRFADRFHLSGFESHDLDGTGSDNGLLLELGVASSEDPNHYTQVLAVSVRDDRFTVRNRYWSAGACSFTGVVNIDHDRTREILLRGTGADHEHGVLTILDVGDGPGRSPESQEQFLRATQDLDINGLSIRFPRTELSHHPAFGTRRGMVEEIELDSGDTVLVAKVSDVAPIENPDKKIGRVGFQLSLKGGEFSARILDVDYYISALRKLIAEKAVEDKWHFIRDENLDVFTRDLPSRIEYWEYTKDGGRWSPLTPQILADLLTKRADPE